MSRKHCYSRNKQEHLVVNNKESRVFLPRTYELIVAFGNFNLLLNYVFVF